MTETDSAQKIPLAIIRVGWLSLVVNISLVAVKLTLSFLTGSLALRADGIHSMIDVFASIALIVGLLISGRRSRSFPYGLYKVENLVSAVIAFLLFFTAYEIVVEAIRAGTPTPSYGGWILPVVASIILVTFLFSRYELRMGKKHNSPSLMADGSQFMADVFGSTIVFLALLGQFFGFRLDRIGAAIIALFIVYAAWGQLRSSMRVLLDASIDSETLEKVKSIIQAEPAVGSVKSLVGRNSGRYIFVETNITVRASNFEKAYLISEIIEQKIRKALPNIDRVSIHYEPEEKIQLRYAIPLSSTEGQIAQDFGQAAYFALVDVGKLDKTVIKQEIVTNPFTELAKGRGIRVAEFLLTYKPDIVLSKENLSSKGPGYALADAGAEILQTEALTLDEVLSSL